MATPDPLPVVPKTPSRRPILIYGGCAAVLLLVVFLGYRRCNLPPIRRFAPTTTIEPLTSEPGLVASPTFSPDGLQIAYTWNGNRQENYDIYIKKLGSQQATRLTKSPEVDFNPVWSPDGKFIAFCRSGDGENSAIWIVSLSDGTERRLAEQWSVVPSSRFLTWSPDSKRLVFSGSATDERASGLLELDVASGSIQFLTRTKDGVFDLQPAYSSDGRNVAFVRDIGRGMGRISMIPMKPEGGANGDVVTLQWPGFESAYVGFPVWTPDSENILFSSNRNPEQYLWMVKATAGATPRMLGNLGPGILDAAMSRTGQLALVHERLDIDIAKLDVGRLRHGETVTPEIVVNSTRVETNPKISPDGSRVAFESNRSGPHGDLGCECRRHQSYSNHKYRASKYWVTGVGRRTQQNRLRFALRWIPRIYVLPAAGGKVEPLTGVSDLSVVPAWSPDGAWIYFTSDRTGHPEIWRVPSTGGPAQQLTKTGGFSPIILGIISGLPRTAPRSRRSKC